MTDLNNLQFEEVSVPAGSFLGWGDHQGQFVTGAVLDYNPEGGTDFNGAPCPQLVVDLMAPAASFNKAGDRTDFQSGEIVTLNCGLANLKRAVKYANLERGDVVKIELVGFEKVDKGTVKVFKLQVARGAAAGRTPTPQQQQAPAQGFGQAAPAQAPAQQQAFGAPADAAPPF